MVQRETHELDRGRAFARFDTRFQLAWVLGALMPVLLRPPLRVGFSLLALGLAVGLVLYLSALRSVQPEAARRQDAGPAPPDEVLATARRLLDAGEERSAVVLAASAALDHPRLAVRGGDSRCGELATFRRRALGDGEPLSTEAAVAALDLAADLIDCPSR
ncbi:MAG: hypothetical protein GEV08_07645 [Acidimicrobiia bacterium]|nr:hypothetical protein [Acidimicrobiia bacterium]